MILLRRHNHDPRIRNRLFRQHPYCNWCGRRVVPSLNMAGRHPSNEATLDHILDRRQAPSQEAYLHPSNSVLACHRCNQRRSRGRDLSAVVPAWTPLSGPEISRLDRLGQYSQYARCIHRSLQESPFQGRFNDRPVASFKY